MAELAAFIVFVIIFSGLAVGIGLLNVVFIVKFSDPIDRGKAILPRLFVWIGLTAAFVIILLLPFDKCSRPYSTAFMPLVWQIVYIAAAALCIVILPFFLYYYEAFDDTKRSCCGVQIIKAIVGTLIYLIAIGLVIGLMYGFLGYADLDVYQYEAIPVDGRVAGDCQDLALNGAPKTVVIRVSIVVYIISILTWFGWFLFCIFGGAGLTALPVDLITDWITRPRKLSKKEYEDLNIECRQNAELLLKRLSDFEVEHCGKEKYSARHRRELQKMSDATEEIEHNVAKLHMLLNPKEYNACLPWFQLIIGILGILVSLTFIAHLIVHNCANIYPLLNIAFEEMDRFVPFFGVAFYGVFVAYLEWAVIKGNIKVGLNFLLFSIHPMKLNKTMANSLLFNTILILFATFALLQFSAASFNVYSRGAAVAVLFDSQMRKLRFLRYFFDYFVYAFLGISLLSFIVSFTITFCCKCMKRRRQENKAALKEIAIPASHA